MRPLAPTLVTPEQIEHIFRVADEFGLFRDAIIIPLKAHPTGLEMVLPDGRILVHPPAGATFDTWFAGFRERLAHMDLSRVPRVSM